jgi:hypothetical protein
MMKRAASHVSFASPRTRGEAGAQRRVRGTLRESDVPREPLTPTLSRQAGRGGALRPQMAFRLFGSRAHV